MTTLIFHSTLFYSMGCCRCKTSGREYWTHSGTHHVSISFYHYPPPSLSFCIYLSVYLSVFLSIYPSFYLSTRLSISVFIIIYPSFNLPIRLSRYLYMYSIYIQVGVCRESVHSKFCMCCRPTETCSHFASCLSTYLPV